MATIISRILSAWAGSTAEPSRRTQRTSASYPVSVPSVSAEVPSFAGNNLGFVAVKPNLPVEVRPDAQPDALDQDVEAGGGGNTTLIVIGVVVVVAIVVAIILLTGK